MLTDRLKFSAEAAYLPRVRFRAQDDHNYRQLFIQEASSHGDGTMLEGVLNYAVTPNWSVGLGGRFWAWNMHDGTVMFDWPGLPLFGAADSAATTPNAMVSSCKPIIDGAT